MNMVEKKISSNFAKIGQRPISRKSPVVMDHSVRISYVYTFTPKQCEQIAIYNSMEYGTKLKKKATKQELLDFLNDAVNNHLSLLNPKDKY